MNRLGQSWVIFLDNLSRYRRPLVSVVIPAFNRGKTISYCLNSVLAQTYENIEVVVVDDCSTDNTVEVVNGYSDPRVRCIVLEKNSGAQAARNRGIKEATGDWIAFQDSDDEWKPRKLEKQVEALAEVKYDHWTVVHSNALRYYASNNTMELWKLPRLEGENLYSTMLLSKTALFPAMLTSKIALEKIGYLDEQVPSFQEWDTSIRLSKYCRFIHIKEPLFIYNLHDDEAISKDKKKNILGRQYIIEKYENDIKAYCGERAWSNALLEQLERCLDFKLWSDFDKYLSEFSFRNDFNFGLPLLYLKICRLFHCQANNVLGKMFKFLLQIKEHGISWGCTGIITKLKRKVGVSNSS